jgi:ABC-type Zn2+ transport system substrate-binding protein/surface adhesin
MRDRHSNDEAQNTHIYTHIHAHTHTHMHTHTHTHTHTHRRTRISSRAGYCSNFVMSAMNMGTAELTAANTSTVLYALMPVAVMSWL